MGAKAYPEARKLLITADSGGSNGARVRLWKIELQKLADKTGLQISVCHLPPDQQVEQDRASAVLFHQSELARQAAGEPSGDRQSHRGDNHQDRVEGPC